jgi:enamidase
MLVVGDPSTTIADVRNVDTVFRKGVGFDPVKLIASVKGKVGLW